MQPVAIRYLNAQGEPSERVAYINDMSLWDSVLGILGEPCLRIEVHYLPLLEHGERSRRELAQLSEEAVRGALFESEQAALPLTPTPLPEGEGL
ncbi:MAG: hypothetical protein R3E95_16235 [Thiolinea sp.]